ncbi:hypothetical protein, partial [Acidithiobacillus sp.]|uniref:hypothetical protein n=1 Tax=Acidithiobacillus sp. TaxID=1872118 RepID=UPI003CFF344D
PSEKGAQLWEEAQRVGLALSVEHIDTFRNALDALESGALERQAAAEHAFHTIGLELDEPLDWMDIDGLRQESPETPVVSAGSLPKDLGYPPSIDPEIRLPHDAPERAARLERERLLAERWGERWEWFGPRQRAILRLQKMIQDRGGATAEAFAHKTRFDVLFRWEIGLAASEPGIEPEELADRGQV